MEFNYKPLSLNQVSLIPYMGQSLVWHSIIAVAFIFLPLTLKKLNIISGDQKVVLAVSIFGRKTPLTLEMHQIDKKHS